MMRLLEGLVGILSLFATQERPIEIYHVDLERALESSARAGVARRQLLALQAELQGAAERREAHIAKLRKRSQRSRLPADSSILQKAVDEHSQALEADARRLSAREEAALGPMIEAARRLVAAANTDERRVVIMEDTPLVAAPDRCERTKALTEALDDGRPFEPVRAEVCRVHALVLLGFDLAVKSSRSGIEAAKRVEELRARLQSEVDEKQRRVAALAETERYAGELELAEQFRMNQTRLRAFEDEEEGRLFLRLSGKLERVGTEMPGVRFVDAASLEVPGVTICRAEAWSKDIIDGDADLADLRRICGLKPPR